MNDSNNTMSVREFTSRVNALGVDVDVCDDYNETCYICYCGDPDAKLTEAGEEHFAPALDRAHVRWDGHGNSALIMVHDDPELLKNVRELFYAAAGYCPGSKYDLWFNEEP